MVQCFNMAKKVIFWLQKKLKKMHQVLGFLF